MCETNARKRRGDDHVDAEIRSQIENEQSFPSLHASKHSSENVRNAYSNKRASLDTKNGDEGSTKEDKNRLPRANMTKPPRPMSAYNMFFRDERAKILAAATDAHNAAESSREGDQKPSSGNSSNEGSKARRRPHGVISFGQLGKTIAARWKTIDADMLAQYNKLAIHEKELYREKVQEYFKNQDEILEQYRKTCTANPTDTTGEGTVSSDVPASPRGGIGTSAVAMANEEADAFGRNRSWPDARPLRLDSEGVASLSTLLARARGASTQYVAADDVQFRVGVGVPTLHLANKVLDDAMISSMNRHTAVDVPFRVEVPTVQPANIIENAGISRASRCTLRDHGYHAYDGFLGHDQMTNYGYPFVRPRSDSVIPQLSGAAAASPMFFSATRNHAQYPVEKLHHTFGNATGLNYGMLQSNVVSGEIANRRNFDVCLQRPAAEMYDPALLHYRYAPHLMGHANNFSPDASSLQRFISRPNFAVSRQQDPIIKIKQGGESPSATETFSS